jgi:23S rRNA maturation-related 3'-5' exoribonuclease YhaM
MEPKIVENEIKELLKSTKKEGMENLIIWLEKEGFFNAPGSTKFHGNYPGGLAEHSLNVYILFNALCDQFKVNLPPESRAVTALLHDICKVGLYKGEFYYYTYDSSIIAQGHAKLSIERIKQFITLTPTEEKLIRYHMSFYSIPKEYDLQELWMVFNDPVCKLFYFCDDMTSQFVDVKK